MKRSLLYVLLLALALGFYFIKRYRNTTSNLNVSQQNVNRDRGFDRRVSYLQYSNHAKCRMECRHITEQEVEEAMQEGKINYKKSDIRNSRCPRYALEEITKDDQHIRVVFAQCNNYTEVVTVIDLGTEWTCDCPGDDNKYKNRN
jgi:hypothetical protein